MNILQTPKYDKKIFICNMITSFRIIISYINIKERSYLNPINYFNLYFLSLHTRYTLIWLTQGQREKKKIIKRNLILLFSLILI